MELTNEKHQKTSMAKPQDTKINEQEISAEKFPEIQDLTEEDAEKVIGGVNSMKGMAVSGSGMTKLATPMFCTSTTPGL